MDQLAELSGLTQGHLSRLERSLQYPTVRTLVTVAAALSVEIVDLVIDPVGSSRHAVISATAMLDEDELAELADELRSRLDDDDGELERGRKSVRGGARRTTGTRRKRAAPKKRRASSG